MLQAIAGPAPEFGAAVALPAAIARNVPPILFVHGIVDNLRRWLHPLPELREREKPFPTYDTREPGQASPKTDLPLRLLEECDRLGVRGLAYSYQLPETPGRAVVPLDDAIAAFQRMLARTQEVFAADQVCVVAHSRGGLIARIALDGSSTRRGVAQVITLGTPHIGTQLAAASDFLLGPAAKVLAGLSQRIPLEAVRNLGAVIDGFRGLAPDGAEIQRATKAGFPSLPRGWAAAAGDVAAFARFDLARWKILGHRILSLPNDLRRFGPFALPEFTDGEGDMAVSVRSALAVPDGSPRATFRANHLTLCHQAEVVAWVFAQLGLRPAAIDQ